MIPTRPCTRCGEPALGRQYGPAKCPACRPICPRCNVEPKACGESYCRGCQAKRAKVRYDRLHAK